MSKLEGTYTLDPAHSIIGFSARHAMVTKVRGQFTDYDATLVYESADSPNNAIEVTIKADSVTTGNDDRDAHIKGDDFFNVEEYPTLTFRATSIDLPEQGEGTVTGELTIRDTTKTVELQVEIAGIEEDPFGNVRVGFEARTKINRKDFGVNFQAPLNSGGLLVSEDVTIEIEGSAIKN